MAHRIPGRLLVSLSALPSLGTSLPPPHDLPAIYRIKNSRDQSSPIHHGNHAWPARDAGVCSGELPVEVPSSNEPCPGRCRLRQIEWDDYNCRPRTTAVMHQNSRSGTPRTRSVDELARRHTSSCSDSP